MTEPIVRLRGVVKTFEGGRIVALAGVDLDVTAGEFVSIMGPSGSGKTTLLNLIGAMDLPTSGEVQLNGVRVGPGVDLDAIRARRIGFVFQMHNLIPVLSARDNVEIPMIAVGVPRRVRRARALDLLDHVGLAPRAHAKARVLSGGERQRVAVARALANEPAVILADEPTGNLDTKTGAEVMEVLQSLRRKKGAALVLVTHNEEIARGADRRFRMQDGQLHPVV